MIGNDNILTYTWNRLGYKNGILDKIQCISAFKINIKQNRHFKEKCNENSMIMYTINDVIPLFQPIIIGEMNGGGAVIFNISMLFGPVDKAMTLMVVVWRGDYVSANLSTLIGGKIGDEICVIGRYPSEKHLLE